MFYDNEFLKKLHKHRQRETYVRITLLTFDEAPIEYIEGQVTGGSINIDGASAVRRTCSLTMVTNNTDINIFLLGLERKFKLEIGLKNTIDSSYPDVIWFKQGTFITTGITSARQVANYTLSISGKDKMCLLNGDVAGTLPSSVDFGKMEVEADNGRDYTYEYLKIKDIIHYAVETYGNEQPYNIIINDLDDCGLELLDYKGSIDAYILRNLNTNNCTNITFDESFKVTYRDETKTIAELKESKQFVFDSFTEDLVDSNDYSIVYLEENNNPYSIIRVTQGQTIGYRQTDLIYTGDLIGNVGDSLTSILDKLKNMLGEFEYFYDIDGRFIFQKKPIYLSVEQHSEDLTTTITYYQNNKIFSNIFFSFEDNDLIISFNNTPDFGNVKNDFSIWGNRESVTGADHPIHLRYAIDSKPRKYITYGNEYTYIAGEDGTYEEQEDNKTIICDWREILYQMALDYNKFRDIKEDFYNQIIKNNLDERGMPLYPTGRTNYEQYYIDMMGFWREIFSNTKDEKDKFCFYKEVLLSPTTYKINTYYTRSYKEEDIAQRFPIYTKCKDVKYDDNKRYFELVEQTDSPLASMVRNEPYQLNFWIDFLDGTGDLSRYSTKAIGQRTKNVNESDVTSIYYRQVPNLIFYTDENAITYGTNKTAYSYVRVNTNVENCLAISTQGISAWEVLEDDLNNYTYCKESVSITAVPIYHMQPNVKISVKDKESKVNGEYLVSKITLPLTYNGNMSITATKVIPDII